MRQTLIFKSRWGWMGLAQSSAGITSVVLSKSSKREVQASLGSHSLAQNGPSPRLLSAKKQVIEYLEGKRIGFTMSLDLSQGTVFQRRVWNVLRQVPYGRLSSYRNVAALVGGTRYARAVGNAVGSNPVPILIPCHRVVAHDGSLGGFSCGLPVKRKLLALEGSLSQVKRHGKS